MTNKPENWPDDKLRRKANQHWEMAGLARQDRDTADVIRHTETALRYEAILKERRQ